jgi:preprotein translocase subunit SecA
MNKQREVIYETRRAILEGEDLRDQTLGFLGDVVADLVAEYCPQGVYPEDWDLDGLAKAVNQIYPTEIDLEGLDRDGLDHAEFEAMLLDDAERAYKAREDELGPEALAELERWVLLSVLDRHWREHLYEMDYLQEGIGLRAIGQRDPLVEYQREGFDMFQAMQDSIKREAVAYVFNAPVEAAEQAEERHQTASQPRTELSSAVTEAEQAAAGSQPQNRPGGKKVGRNQPCPCGSGKKFKNCHGAPTAPRV